MRREARTILLASSLIFDAAAGIALAVLVGPVIGAIIFVLSAGASIMVFRSIRAKAAPPDNPYARED